MSEIPVEGRCDPRFDVVRELFERSFAHGEVGAAVCFTLDGEPVVDLWGGHVDEERTRPWRRDTLVNTYSTTKGMTALCAHILVDEGRLDVDAPVARYWPEFDQAGKARITVRQLLNHSAGVTGVRKELPAETLYDWDAMVSALAAEAPWWEPGTRHGYHAMTFGFLVGEVVRRVSGQSVGSFFRERVAEPLGADYHIGLPEALEARTADLIGGFAQLGKRDGGTARPKGDAPENPLLAFVRDMFDPKTLAGAAFNNPRLRSGSANSRAWRAAEIPAANGHGTAAALARIYGALACGGEGAGVRLLRRETLETAIQEEVFGPDAVLGGLPMRFAQGFMLSHDLIRLGPNPRAFGHAGAGGSIGFADPDARVGFGFTMNRMQMGLLGSMNALRMIPKFFQALEAP